MSATTFVLELVDVPQQTPHRRKLSIDPADISYICETAFPFVCGMRSFGTDSVIAAQFDELSKALHDFRSGKMEGMFKFTIPVANFVVPDQLSNAKAQ